MRELNQAQAARHREYRAFVNELVTPRADQMDAEQRTPQDMLEALANRGYLGGCIPAEYGGSASDALSYGLLCHELGRGSGSLLSLLTVHGMVSASILKWGSDEQRATYLPRLARGELIGAFAVSEPEVGSDAQLVGLRAVEQGNAFLLSGRKKWISYAELAGLFLVLARTEAGPTAFLVERNQAGFSCTPIRGMFGFRAAMLGELQFDACRVPSSSMLGRPGLGFSYVGSSALDLGRFCIAWGAVGLAQECLDLSLSYSSRRKQGGTELANHQLIQRLVADMMTDVRAARALCLRAAELREERDPDSILETSIAKYFSSKIATRVASDAVQIHGANGVGPDFATQRHFRDARILEIIEGSNEIQQTVIAKAGYQSLHFREEST
jgi:alkylation response protein AidB-like acyl-CoA dehydrogenase